MEKRNRKYRVWDIHHKIFLPTDTYGLITTDFGAFGIMIKDWENYKVGEYMYPNAQIQSDFTGLHDKQGIEINEGDIVMGGGCLKPIEVKWNYKGRWSFGEQLIDFTQSTMDALEVIGNIHQNPELL